MSRRHANRFTSALISAVASAGVRHELDELLPVNTNRDEPRRSTARQSAQVRRVFSRESRGLPRPAPPGSSSRPRTRTAYAGLCGERDRLRPCAEFYTETVCIGLTGAAPRAAADCPDDSKHRRVMRHQSRRNSRSTSAAASRSSCRWIRLNRAVCSLRMDRAEYANATARPIVRSTSAATMITRTSMIALPNYLITFSRPSFATILTNGSLLRDRSWM